LPIVIIANIFYVIGVPLLMIILLVRARSKGIIGTPKFDYRFGSITMPYQPNCWYFEVVNTTRKLSVVLVVEFLARDATVNGTAVLSQIAIAMSIFSGYTLLQVFVSPYTFNWNNRLSLMTTISLLFVLFSAELYANSALSDIAKWYTAVITIIIVVACLVAVIVCVMIEYARARARHNTSTALGLNRYQISGMENRLLNRMFPDAGPLLINIIGHQDEQTKDAFLQNCFQLLRLMPSKGLDPYHALKAAQDEVMKESQEWEKDVAGKIIQDHEVNIDSDNEKPARVEANLHSAVGIDSPRSGLRDREDDEEEYDDAGSSDGDRSLSRHESRIENIRLRAEFSPGASSRTLRSTVTTASDASSSSHPAARRAKSLSSPKRLRLPTETRLLWTGRQVEQLQLTYNPLVKRPAERRAQRQGRNGRRALSSSPGSPACVSTGAAAMSLPSYTPRAPAP
jgi:hypothetical protein